MARFRSPLTRYPLLFENLCNCTPHDTEEYKKIQRAVDLSKEILTLVNGAKKEAEDQERLIEIQKKLDKSSFEKGFDKTDPTINEIRVCQCSSFIHVELATYFGILKM